jgi:hypothetical protein
MGDAAHRLRLFVSAGPDLEMEHEAIGQAVARIPAPSLGWAIGRTPRRGEPQFVPWDELAAADFYALLLGSDIQAPVGAELWAARRAGKRVLAFRKNVLRTQAAEAFARDAGVDWVEYEAVSQVACEIQIALVREILARGPVGELWPLEHETLRGFLEKLRAGEMEMLSPEQEGGAGGGGVILVPGKDLPPGGVLVDSEKEDKG